MAHEVRERLSPLDLQHFPQLPLSEMAVTVPLCVVVVEDTAATPFRHLELRGR